MRLSQAHLTLLESCPRKFQYVYLDQVVAPVSPDDQHRREWGTHFHLMMQQRELGITPLPRTILSQQQQPQSEGAFYAAVDALVAQLPDVFREEQSSNRYSEHRKTLDIHSHDNRHFLLTAVYDLVFFEEHQTTIFDWKTYQKPKTHRWLAEHWQTRLYPFVLTETSDLDPHQVSMVYWFVQSREGEAIAPESMTFTYDHAQHDAIRQTLCRLLEDLSNHLIAYEQGISMPKVSEEKGRCGLCPFAIRCGRSPLKTEQPLLDVSALLNIDQIAEIPLQNHHLI
ncbi:MAG: PD-(D/E)XK nuclease family protein [Cyanobacteria bacterium P01_E01_bin.6]